MSGDRQYLRAADIARLTGVSIRTARRWIAKRLLASAKIGGARLVTKSELQRLLSPLSEAIGQDTQDDNE
jgi:excisionase family DNA binding protein